MKKENFNSMILVAVTAVILFALAIGGMAFFSHQKTLRLEAEMELSKEKLKQESLQKELDDKKKEETAKKEETSKAIENIDKVGYEAKLISQMAPLENQMQAQIDSGNGMNSAVNTLLEAWDTELNKVYKLLMSELPESEKAKLKSSERSWIAKKEAAVEADASENGGSDGRLIAAGTALDMTKKRTLELARLYDDLHK